MRDRRIPDVPHLAAATSSTASTRHGGGALAKETCRNCNCTVYVLPDGTVTDSELIRVMPIATGKRKRGERVERIAARRLHAETCERRAREATQAKLRAEKAEYERNRKPEKLPPVATWEDNLRRTYLAAIANMGKLARAAAEPLRKRGRARGL